MREMNDKLWNEIEQLRREVERLRTQDRPAGGFIPLTTPLTSTSWDGDAYSTTAKTKIDLSVVFGAPAGIKAVLVRVDVRDSGSAAGDRWFILGPNNTHLSGFATSPMPVNDRPNRTSHVVPCDASGDIYYQIGASGAGTMDVWLEIWGYWI